MKHRIVDIVSRTLESRTTFARPVPPRWPRQQWSNATVDVTFFAIGGLVVHGPARAYSRAQFSSRLVKDHRDRIGQLRINFAEHAFTKRLVRRNSAEPTESPRGDLTLWAWSCLLMVPAGCAGGILGKTPRERFPGEKANWCNNHSIISLRIINRLRGSLCVR